MTRNMPATPDATMTQGLDKQLTYAILDDVRSRMNYGRFIVLDEAAFDMLKQRSRNGRPQNPSRSVPCSEYGYRLTFGKDEATFLDRRLSAGLYCFETRKGGTIELTGLQGHKFLMWNRSFMRWQFQDRVLPLMQWQDETQVLPSKSETHPCQAYPFAKHDACTYVHFITDNPNGLDVRILLNNAIRGKSILVRSSGTGSLAYCNGKAVVDCASKAQYAVNDSRLYDGTRFLELETGRVLPLARWAGERRKSRPRLVSLQWGKWQARVTEYSKSSSLAANAPVRPTPPSLTSAAVPGGSAGTRSMQRPSAIPNAGSRTNTESSRQGDKSRQRSASRFLHDLVSERR